MKKIGLASVYKVRNYGTVLQSFATQKALQKLGFDSICINYQKKKDLKTILSYVHTIFVPYVLKMKLEYIKKDLIVKKHGIGLIESINKRNSVFDNFVQRKLVLSPPVKGYAKLRNIAKDFSALLVGSDQIWHPLNLGSHFYTLEWGYENQKKIAYASSFGVSKIPFTQKRMMRSFLTNIDCISCREISGASIVRDLTGKEVPVVVDPTLLHTAEEWDCYLDNPSPVVTEKYIFCYFLGNNPDQRTFANKLKKETSLQIVFLPHLDEFIESDEDFGDIRLYDIGPAEFFSLIKNASYICTDSFHGTVFSILNKKKFATFNRYPGKQASTNSRIDSLFSLLHLQQCRFTANQPVEHLIDLNVDYHTVFNFLYDLRNKSVEYLFNALKDIEC